MKQMPFAILAAAMLLAAPVLLFTSPAAAQGILQLHEPGDSPSDLPPPSESEGVIIVPPHPPRPHPPVRPRPRPVQPAELTSLEVSVEIEGRMARTTLDQSFRNPNDRLLEGTYLFPLPPDAVVKDLSLYIDGKPVKCEVLEAGKARAIYEEIVRKMRDPALLEYVGRDLVKLRIFPIEPGQVRRVKFAYSQILRSEFGLTEYAYPLVPRNAAARRIESFAISGSIRSDVPMTTVYSPTHKIEFVKKDEKTVKFSYEKEKEAPSSDLKIYFAVSEKDLGAGLVTWREKGEDGYFMLMVAPRRGLQEKKILPKDVTFVFDTSGSMSGDKIVQARKALEFCLNGLREKDRFNVIRFSSETESFAEKLAEASPGRVREAIDFVRRFEATGGTNIRDALIEALNAAGERDGNGRPHLIVFLTDGKPTVGERDPDRIVRDVQEKNKSDARIFAFGVDNDVNTILLDKLSGQNGGVSEYVTPKEDIEIKVSNFFTKVSDPVLTDLALDYGGAKISKQYPRELPDLFAGSQITIVGRYEGSGKKTLVLGGRMGEEKKSYEYEVEFPEQSESGDFLPRLWAIRRVGNLVDEIRKNGEDKELVDEVVRLGKKYAIATPYTSLLVLEDETPAAMGQTRLMRGGGNRNEWAMRPSARADLPSPQSAPSMAPQAGRRESAGTISERLAYDPAGGFTGDGDIRSVRVAGGTGGSSPLADSGAAAVAAAKETRRMKESETAAGDSEAVRQVAGRTFLLRDGVWTDSEYDGQAATTDIEYGSDAYFDLLAKDGEIGKFLALGARVIFRLEGVWHRITENPEG